MTLRRLQADDRGNSVTEFALILPLFLTTMLFVMEGALYSWTKSGLRHGAVEAARCAAVDATNCASVSATQAYASDHAFGLHPPASAYSVSDQACGKQVTVTFTYEGYFDLIPMFDGTITQSACYLG